MPRDHCLGDKSACDPLQGLAGHIVQGNRHHSLAGNNPAEQAFIAAKLAQQPCRNQRFGERAGGKRAAGLFHQQGRFEQPHAHAAVALRHAHGKSAKFRKPAPHLGIETRRHRGAHAHRARILVKETREGLADHFLLFCEVKIHWAALSR